MNTKTNTPAKKPMPAATKPGAPKPAAAAQARPAPRVPGGFAAKASPLAQAKNTAAKLSGTKKSVFAGIEKAKASFASNWERAGHYIERIDRVKLEENRKNIMRVVVEKTVLYVVDKGNAVLPHNAGDQVVDIISSDKDAFQSNVKQLILGVFGVADEDITEEYLEEEIFADDKIGMFSGLIVEMSNQDITTLKGSEFTKKLYVRPVPAKELSELLDGVDYGQRVKDRFFRNGLLDQMIEAEGGDASLAPAEAAGDTDAGEQVEDETTDETDAE